MIALEFSTFLGRFHPLFVHLPIGFLFLAIVLEWYESFKKTEVKSKLIPFAWLLGALSAAGAAISGWFLGETGLYEEEHLFAHRWLGIALVIVAFIGWYLKSKPKAFPIKLQHGFNILLLAMLFIEGHKGGNLTHGETYLTEYAPAPIQKLLGAKDAKDSGPSFMTPDSVQVYADLVAPIFEAKCVGCHNDEIKRGGLNMSHPDSLRMGGESENVITAGNTQDSELFRRITLPPKNVKFMPPTNNALTYDEIKTVEWWIEQGAPFEGSLTSLNVTENIKPVLLRRYGIDTNPKPWYETVQLQKLDSIQLSNLVQQGFEVKILGPDNSLLDVKYSGSDLTQEKLAELHKVKDYVTWLNLANTNVSDEQLSNISEFVNLTRLQLEKTEISDKGVSHLAGLEHLEALNLYGTKVTDACLPSIEKISSLKRVYLWQTGVSAQTAKNIQENNEKLKIVIGKG
ncbi:c-type cytochrome domain-containing protein [uncultured Zobellia sp.]|uniref:c-type cytochrome domain-containing protein n=1 Tax=uncultured Zobellia sp. TaxID=255433 RepID=UPI0025992A08|nr:c-type cytochrome domain-containing protein [uncultured Zobellia sp.]